MTNHSLCLVGGSDGLVHKLWVHANNARLQIRDCFFFLSSFYQDHWSVFMLAPVAFPCQHCCCDEIHFSKFSGVQRYWLIFSLQQKRLDSACFRGSDPRVTSGFTICTETDWARMAAGGGLSFLIVSLQKISISKDFTHLQFVLKVYCIV